MARKIKSARHKNYALYYLVRHSVFMAKLLGVLPASVDKWELNSKPYVSYKFKKTGLVFTTIQLLVLAYMTYVGHKYFMIALEFRNAALLQVICVISLAASRTFMLHLFSLLYRTKETIQCLNKASSLVPGIEESNTSRRSIIVCFMAYNLVLPTTFGLFARIAAGSDFLATFPFVISNLQENALVFLLIVLFEIVELSLKGINRTIRLLKERFVDVLPRLEKLMVHHSQTCDLFDKLSQCFGPDVALLCWYNLMKIVLLTYYSYYLFIMGDKRLIEHLIAGSDVPYRFFIVWYLGFKCDNITFQAVETRRLLAELATDRYDKLDDALKETMLQMCVTYIVVLVQFHSFIDIFDTH